MINKALKSDIKRIQHELEVVKTALCINNCAYVRYSVERWGNVIEPIKYVPSSIEGVEEKLDMLLEHLGLEYKKVSASDEYYTIEAKEK